MQKAMVPRLSGLIIMDHAPPMTNDAAQVNATAGAASAAVGWHRLQLCLALRHAFIHAYVCMHEMHDPGKDSSHKRYATSCSCCMHPH